MQSTHSFLKSALSWFRQRATKSFILKLVLVIVVIILVSAVGVYLIERNNPNQPVGRGFSSIGEALWWMVVVLTKTPGYVGVYPMEPAARAISLVLILIGLSLIPLITAKIASYMVTQRLREERGLEKIRNKGHTIICGWNEHIGTVLDSMVVGQELREVVLVNSLTPEKMNEMLLRYKARKPKFVNGDFTNEAVLDLANVRQAATVIILTDKAQGDESGADERVILGTLAVRAVNPKARVCVEILEGKMAQHVRRAGASEVIVHGEHDPYMIVLAALSEGVVLTARQLLLQREGSALQQKPIPAEYIGRKFGELAAYFKERQNAILIGLYCLGRSLCVEDVLGGDYSLIDEFIERKFKEAGKEYLSSQLEMPQANLNPGDEYVVKQGEIAILIGK